MKTTNLLPNDPKVSSYGFSTEVTNHSSERPHEGVDFVPAHGGGEKILSALGDCPRDVLAGPNLGQRKVESLNREWKFLLGDTPDAIAEAFPDSDWDPVGLPHSFSIPYFRSRDFYVGFGWYRRSLEIPAVWASGKSLFLEFDGVFQEAEVFVNGMKVGGHRGGYTGFSIDITKAVRTGSNTLAVRVNNHWNASLAPRAGEHVFSGGIYRNVRLVVTDVLHVDWYGTEISTPHVSRESATVRVKTTVTNDSAEPKSCTLVTEVISPEGQTVARMESRFEIPAGSTSTRDQASEQISSPLLWHPDHPHLYTVKSLLFDGGHLVDEFASPLGFRWFEWTADRGFFLNGEHFYLCGANVHQDHAGWGDAVTDAGAFRDVRLVKEAGFDFIRGSHYPHSPAFSMACDKLGVLYMSENCFWGTGGSKRNGYWDSSAYPLREEDAAPFEESVKSSLREMIRIHRNHPSIFSWSMCNEVFFTSPETLPKVKRFLNDLVEYSHELDPSRLAVIGGCQRSDLEHIGDIAGLNGDGASLSQFQNPGIPNLVTEYGSTMDDRPGSYEPGWGLLPVVYGADENQPYPWRYAWRSGEAIWCAFDHGSIAGSRFGGMGILDYFRLPKRQWYWYRNEYRKIAPPAWPVGGTPAGLRLEADKTTLQGCDGTDDALVVVTVVDAKGRALSNCPPVALSVESGPGEFPTGPSITFEADSDIAIRDGQAAIEFRSYHAGETVLRATSPGLTSATLQIRTEGFPAYEEGLTAKVKPRPYVCYQRVLDPNAASHATEFGFGNPVRASGEVAGHTAPMANDADKNTFWQSPDDTGEAWWQVNLERFVTATRVRLVFPTDAARHYRIETSEDGVGWKTIVDRSDSPVTGMERPEDIARGTVLHWVRVTFYGIRPGFPATLTELSVSGSLAVLNTNSSKKTTTTL